MRNLILASTIAVFAALLAASATANVEYSANNAAVRAASQKNADFITAQVKKSPEKRRCGKKRTEASCGLR